MAPQPKVEMCYIHFQFTPTWDKNKVFWRVFRRNETPDGRISDFLVGLRPWVENIYAYERCHLSSTTKVKFTEWRVMSNNSDLFTLYNMFFDRILLVLGEEYSYWTFYSNGKPHRKQIQGKGKVPLKYCHDCIDTQYTDIMERIKEHVEELLKVRSIDRPLPLTYD